jgi:Na+-transporting NADH:ubiquinone oxidoreductase subunit B
MKVLASSGARSGPPFVGFGLTTAAVTILQCVALLPAVLVAVSEYGFPAGQAAAVAIAVSLLWEIIFAISRRRQVALGSVTTALILTVMLPGTVSILHLAMAVSFGVVLAELVFGGRGFGFLSPAVAALAFLAFSFPGSQIAGSTLLIAIATLPGAVLLLVTGLISWRVLASAGATFAALTLLLDGIGEPNTVMAAVAFSLVFLVADPLAGPSTNPGRWLYGVLVGGLAVFFGVQSGASTGPNAVVFASLLGSIFAPLIDHMVILALVTMRRRRHG